MKQPVIDARDMKSIIKQISEMVPFYTPEWRFSPDDPDAGSVLALIFAEMLYKNIKIYNKMPEKHQLAFLNNYDIELLPPKPAETYLTFSLSTGANQQVLVSKGTQAYGVRGDTEERVIFETLRDTLITPAKALRMIYTAPKKDIINDFSYVIDAETEYEKGYGSNLLHENDESNLQKHELYISEESILNSRYPSVFKLRFNNTVKKSRTILNCERLSDFSNCIWQYSTVYGWRNFDKVSTKDTSLLLIKKDMIEIDPVEVNEEEEKWIRCIVKPGHVDKVSSEYNELITDGIDISSELYNEDGGQGLIPELMFSNEMQVSEDGTIYPYGSFYNIYDCFYIKNTEILSKKGSKISLKFNVSFEKHRLNEEVPREMDWKLIMKVRDFKEPPPNIVSISEVVFEYWNGYAWMVAASGDKFERAFYTKKEGERSLDLEFQCPIDIKEGYVNDVKGYWLRIRVKSIENQYLPNPIYMRPRVDNVRLNYSYGDIYLNTERCITLNNLEFEDITKVFQNEHVSTKLFYNYRTINPAVYIGLDIPLQDGPLSMFFNVLNPKRTEGIKSFLKWEYFGRQNGKDDWYPVKGEDGTEGFRHSGAVTFSISNEMAEKKIFGSSLYWIRIIDTENSIGDEKFRINSIILNTVMSVEKETVKSSSFFKIKEGVNHTVTLERTPVAYEEVWVDEAGSISEEDIYRYTLEKEKDIRIIKDKSGNEQHIWIRWNAVSSFIKSDGKDRKYIINRNTGEITFGDGIHGAVPAASQSENIKINYAVGGGSRGNLPRYAINGLQNSIAFIEGVTNHVPAIGGIDAERIKEALNRAPGTVKTAMRAVTAEDFENLALEASRDIAKIKCLPNCDIYGKRKTGEVTLVVLPDGGDDSHFLMTGIKSNIEKYILERAPGDMNASRWLNIIRPVFIEVSVSAELLVNEMDKLIYAEKEGIRLLEEFLDPITGNYNHSGWQIGQWFHESVFYTLLKGIEGVINIDKLNVSACLVENGIKSELDLNNFKQPPHGLITNGRHSIDTKYE